MEHTERTRSTQPDWPMAYALVAALGEALGVFSIAHRPGGIWMHAIDTHWGVVCNGLMEWATLHPTTMPMVPEGAVCKVPPLGMVFYHDGAPVALIDPWGGSPIRESPGVTEETLLLTLKLAIQKARDGNLPLDANHFTQ